MGCTKDVHIYMQICICFLQLPSVGVSEVQWKDEERKGGEGGKTPIFPSCSYISVSSVKRKRNRRQLHHRLTHSCCGEISLPNRGSDVFHLQGFRMGRGVWS